MKKTTIASVFLLFLLCSTKSCLSWFNPTTVSPLIDSDGNELVPGFPYYMVSAIRGTGGGLDLGWTENNRCKKFVMQRPSDEEMGTPVVLTPKDPGDCRIFEWVTKLNITFIRRIDPLCPASSTWTLNRYDASAEKAWINTDGGDFGGWFNVLPVESIPNIYKLAACYPGSAGFMKCNHVERFDFEGFRRMGFENSRSALFWPFMFVRVPPNIKQVGGIKEAK